LTDSPGLPDGRPVAWDDRVQVFGDGSVLLGGAPWGVLRIAPAGRAFVRRLRAAGAAGLVPAPGVERSLADLFVRRGVAHPVARLGTAPEVEVVVPVYEQPELLEACLRSLTVASPGLRIIVVDDASTSRAVGDIALAHGATLVRHAHNRGPAAARNTGLRKVSAPIVAFVDADCAVTPGWLDVLTAHFDDPRVAAVAPRIRPHSSRASAGVLDRYQAVRSSLDMGARPELVAHGAPLGFLPSAALLVRRSCLAADAFDERMQVGEDVDLVWRLIDEGHLVRYEPAAVVDHEVRPGPRRWTRRIFDYGTSAAKLDRRHPRRLVPARLSFWNMTAAALMLSRRPSAPVAAAAAVGTLGLAVAWRARTLRASSVDGRVALVIVGRELVSDASSAGHLLRREWWPIGWLALAACPRSTVARAAAAAMLVPPVREWLTAQPRIDLPRYLALRLTEDAAYGSGVIVSAVRSRRPGVLLPLVRLPRRGKR